MCGRMERESAHSARPALTAGGIHYPSAFEWGLITLALLACGWPILFFPLGLDQGIYAVNAARMVHGHPLYSEAWDMKGPGIFFLYAVPVALGGFRVWPIQIMHLLLHGFAAAGLWTFARWSFGRGVAWTTFVVWVVIVTAWGAPTSNGQSDDWLLPFYLWALVWMIDSWQGERPRLGLLAASGACLGCVVWLAPRWRRRLSFCRSSG